MEKCHARSSNTKRCLALCGVFVQSLHLRPRPQRSDTGHWHAANACQAEDPTTLGSRSLSCDHMRPHISAPRHEQTPMRLAVQAVQGTRDIHTLPRSPLPLCSSSVGSYYSNSFFFGPFRGKPCATQAAQKQSRSAVGLSLRLADLSSTLPDVSRAPL